MPEAPFLPESVLRFARQDSGLLVFAGPTGATAAAAESLAAHVETATGRRAERGAPRLLRPALQAPRLLVDGGDLMPADRLFALMEEAESGALVVATMGPADRSPYLRLLDLVELGEDSDCRLSFDRVFYATARVQPGGAVPEAEVHLRPARRR